MEHYNTILVQKPLNTVTTLTTMTMTAMTRTTAMTIIATCPMPSSCSLLIGNPSVPLADFSVVTSLVWAEVTTGFRVVALGPVVWGAALVGLGFSGVDLGVCVVLVGGATPSKQSKKKKIIT